MVLRREHDGLDRLRPVVLVLESDLALRVGPQPRQRAVLADLGLAPDEAVCERDRRRHQDVGLAGRIAEHEPLVARSLAFRMLAIHALRNVR